MTEDLTAELHKLAGFYPNTYHGQLMGKAAREIERLEKELFWANAAVESNRSRKWDGGQP